MICKRDLMRCAGPKSTTAVLGLPICALRKLSPKDRQAAGGMGQPYTPLFAQHFCSLPAPSPVHAASVLVSPPLAALSCPQCRVFALPCSASVPNTPWPAALLCRSSVTPYVIRQLLRGCRGTSGVEEFLGEHDW